jgi:hypothetical protein
MDITPEEPGCRYLECSKSSMCVNDHLHFQYAITSGRAAVCSGHCIVIEPPLPTLAILLAEKPTGTVVMTTKSDNSLSDRAFTVAMPSKYR